MNNIKQFIKILGLKQGDSRILEAIFFIGAGFVLDEFKEENIHDEFYEFYTKGVSFLFDNNYLVAIYFYIAEQYNFSSCDINLIDGINSNSTKDNIVSMLGKPSFLSDINNTKLSWIKYEYEGYSLHFEFNLETKFLQMITLQNPNIQR